jgi:hypothetical protein
MLANALLDVYTTMLLKKCLYSKTLEAHKAKDLKDCEQENKLINCDIFNQ